MDSRDQRAVLSQCLRGQTIQFPAPGRLFPQWARLVHPRLADLRIHVERTVKDVYRGHPKSAALRKADFGLFGATWWPYASYERLQIVTELSIWLFVWDDEIDSVLGAFAASLEKAQAFRRSTLDFVSSSLGLNSTTLSTSCENSIILAFDTFGRRLKEQCPENQRIGLLREIEFFMNKSEIEQKHALSGRIVSFNEYWSFRMGTSAVRVALAVNEFTCDLSLPALVTTHPDMKLMWDACNAIISIVNDVFSVKKELAEDAVDSIIPIVFAATGNAEDAADVATYLLEYYVDDLDQAASRLLRQYGGDERVSKDLEAMILGIRTYCTGNLTWSLSTRRYKTAAVVTEDAMYITL